MWGAPYNHDKKALGVPLKVTSALEAKELPRNTVEEVYVQILADLDEARENIREVAQGTTIPERLQNQFADGAIIEIQSLPVHGGLEKCGYLRSESD